MARDARHDLHERPLNPVIDLPGRADKVGRPVKESAKYAATLLAFIVGAFILSWCSVYSFWIAAHVFHSVAAVRIGDTVGAAILLPARTLLQLSGGLFDQMTLLTNPLLYAAINAALLGILGYALCRRWIFGPPVTAETSPSPPAR